MKKNRIVTRVKDKTGISKSKNRSGDLTELKEKCHQFIKKIRFLIASIQSNHNAMIQLSKMRLEVAKAVNSLTADTPLFKCAGEIPSASGSASSTLGGVGGGDTTALIQHNANATSFAAVHIQLHKKDKLYHDKYLEHILNYATEWERILTTRITNHLKHSEKLRVDLDHYQKKVEDLNHDANKMMSKGKNVHDKAVEKLKRNEAKFVTARQEYDKYVSDLCGFLEEVVDRGWKDLHPLLVKMAQFDGTYSAEEANVLKAMSCVTHELMGLSTKHDFKAQGRLKELETHSLESLNKVYQPNDSTLMLMGGEPGGINSPQPSSDELGVGGGGLFGNRSRNNSENFGSSVGSNDASSFGIGSRNNSEVFTPRSRTNTGESFGDPGRPPLSSRGGSYADLHSTSNMLTIAQAAAPAPTLDDIFGSPCGSNNNPGMNAYAASGNFTSPPPAGMPPPPPAMPPPPPPQAPSSGQQLPNFGGLSMYDNARPVPPPIVPPPISTTAVGFNQSGGYSADFFSPGNISAASNSNPFDDGFGGINNAPTPNNINVHGGGITPTGQSGFASPNSNPFG